MRLIISNVKPFSLPRAECKKIGFSLIAKFNCGRAE